MSPLLTGSHRRPSLSPVGRFLDDPMASMRDGWDHLASLVTAHAALVVNAAILTTIVSILARTALLRWRHHRLAVHARVVDIMPPPSVDMAGAEALWTHLLGLLRPRRLRPITGVPHVAWEYAFTAAGMRVRLWVPGVVPPGLVERAIEGAWPGAASRAVRAEDRPALPLGHTGAGGRLRVARPDHYPLRSEFDTDPLRGLMAAAGSLTGAETVLVQILARPVTGRRLRRAGRYATGLRSPGAVTSVKGGLFAALPMGVPRDTRGPSAARPAEMPAEVRAILAKASRPRLETAVRYVVATDNTHGRAWLRGRAHAVASSYAAYTGFNHLRRRRLRRYTEALRTRRMGHGDLLSVPELAALCHVPTDETVPGLERAGAKPTPPPSALPSGGPDVRVLGTSEAGPRRAVGIRIADARHHIHVIGETGTGKTTGLLSMQLDDAAGRPRAGLHRAQGRLDTPALSSPGEPRRQGRADRPGRPRATPVPQHPRRTQPGADRRRRRRNLPPHLRRVLGTPHRRHPPLRDPDAPPPTRTRPWPTFPACSTTTPTAPRRSPR